MGKTVYEIENIHERQNEIYKDLYAKSDMDIEAAWKLLENVDIKLDIEEKESCEANISCEELTGVVKSPRDK